MNFNINLKALSLVFVFSATAVFANDTAMYTIPVKGIDPTTSKIGGDIVKFYGKEAADFMKLLPPVLTVPPYDKVTAKHNKNLSLASNAYILNFYCEDAVINAEEEMPKVTPIPEGAKCAISLYRNDHEEGGDIMNFRKDGGIDAVINQLQE
jgi:hypothetical protein